MSLPAPNHTQDELDAIADELIEILDPFDWGYIGSRLYNRYRGMVHYRELREQVDGYIYVLRADPYVKIGRSADPDKRIKSLKIQLPFPVEVLHVFPCVNASACERSLHREFKEERRNGEWFQLADYQIEYLTSVALGWPSATGLMNEYFLDEYAVREASL